MAEAHLSQLAIRNNEWQALTPPALGEWTPTRSVSVVVPAYDPRHLDHVLAGLAAQSYPEHLIEVVVVDDGSTPPVRLPEVRPERTRLLRTADGWGRAATCHTGALGSDGEVLHWLDSDMVPCREEVEAHLRWHHLVDYAVVLGTRQFTDDDALAQVGPAALREAVARGRHPRELVTAHVEDNTWTETILRETRELADAGFRAMRLHVGASGSVSRDLYVESGGMPVGMALGEDIVLGYRLREAGAVFIPERAASSLHPGSSGVRQRQDETNRFNRPFFADLVPEFRGHRRRVGRAYTVPYVEVVIPVGVDDQFGAVVDAVDAQLSGTVPDVVVTLLAPWSELASGRRRALDEEHRELRMLQAAYAADPRVRLVEVLAVRSDATFRLRLPGADRYPVGRSLERLVRQCEDEQLGLVRLELGEAGSARLERTASAARALLLDGADPPPDEVWSRVTLVADLDGADTGFVEAGSAPPIKQVRGLVPWGVQTPPPSGPPRDS